jgi:hypothetical protein
MQEEAAVADSDAKRAKAELDRAKKSQIEAETGIAVAEATIDMVERPQQAAADRQREQFERQQTGEKTAFERERAAADSQQAQEQTAFDRQQAMRKDGLAQQQLEQRGQTEAEKLELARQAQLQRMNGAPT